MCYTKVIIERGKRAMGYKAVIFDMDGTVLNTIEDITDPLNVTEIDNLAGLTYGTYNGITGFDITVFGHYSPLADLSEGWEY